MESKDVNTLSSIGRKWPETLSYFNSRATCIIGDYAEHTFKAFSNYPALEQSITYIAGPPSH